MRQLFYILTAALMPVLAFGAEIRIDGVAGYVNAHVITVSDVVKSSRELQVQLAKGEGEGLNEIYLEAFENVIEQKLILDDYDGQKEIRIPDSVVSERVDSVIQDMFDGNRLDLLEALGRDGMSEQSWREQIREQIVVSAMRNLRVDSKVTVSPLAVRDAYDRDADRYTSQPKVKLRMIVIGKGESPNDMAIQREKLEEAVAALKDGIEFSEVAKKYSEDSRAKDGGDRGWMARDMLREDLAALAFSVGVGEVSEPVDIGMQTCLLKVEDRLDAEMISFDEAQPKIERELRVAEAKQLYEAWISRLRRDAFVKIVDTSPF